MGNCRGDTHFVCANLQGAVTARTGAAIVGANFAITNIKNIPFGEKLMGQLRFEGYNLPDHPQFTNPDTNYSDTNFGLINSTRQYSERQLQGAIRITF